MELMGKGGQEENEVKLKIPRLNLFGLFHCEEQQILKRWNGPHLFLLVLHFESDNAVLS